MQQLTQDLKKGHMKILEVPFPALGKGQLLVRNRFSVISAGTEGKTVADARKGYIAKAKSRQKEVRQVIDMIKTQGLADTYKMVMNKLEAPSPLGYSCAGVILAVGEGVTEFKPGDPVACGGAGAYHADVIAVPRNLCVKVPVGVPLEHAAFSTIAAIAVQGMRQADLRFGEICLVIGLGLVGLLTIQLLEAAGIHALGIDLKKEQVAAALENGADLALERDREGLEEIILGATAGYGADAVIITASSSSTDPVNLAGRLCRKKGKVVVVGGVPTGFDRPDYYKKELDLRMSCSYGPGRYDPRYEEQGIDYPVGYVRWTENRNMQAFLDLLKKNKLPLERLISHVFDLTEAPEAYRLILEKSQPFAGILIRYDPEEEPGRKIEIPGERKKGESEASVGLIGAGSFAQNVLLPRMKGRCLLLGVASARGTTSRYVADKYGFDYCTGEAGDILKDPGIDTVFILTRHHLHAGFVIEALKEGKNVFVEKPLALKPAELEAIEAAYREAGEKGHQPLLMVGFNRRFSPLVREIADWLPPSLPRAMNFRVNAGSLPPDHWVQDLESGGGRIIGEACHFIDLALFFAGAPITSVVAAALPGQVPPPDTVALTLAFANGSVANISYYAQGSKKMAKEYLEVFCGGHSAIIDDFKTGTLFGKSVSKKKFKKQDKGHGAEIEQFFRALREGKTAPISFEDICATTRASFGVMDSLAQGRVIPL